MNANPNHTTAELGGEYQRRGWRVLLYTRSEKGPTFKGWPERIFTPEEIAKADGQNIGVVTGPASGGLADVDLDCPEAVALADALMSGTDAVFGRESKRASHLEYLADPVPEYSEWRDTPSTEDRRGAVLLELRTADHQTMFPPSVHPCGERVEWERFGEPTRLDGAALLAQCSELAAAAILARHWPRAGEGRQDAALAGAGGLLRAGWRQDKAATFVERVAAAGHDEYATKRALAVGDTARKISAGEKATGWPRLGEIVGAEVVSKVREWLRADDAENPQLRPARPPQAGRSASGSDRNRRWREGHARLGH